MPEVVRGDAGNECVFFACNKKEEEATSRIRHSLPPLCSDRCCLQSVFSVERKRVSSSSPALYSLTLTVCVCCCTRTQRRRLCSPLFFLMCSVTAASYRESAGRSPAPQLPASSSSSAGPSKQVVARISSLSAMVLNSMETKSGSVTRVISKKAGRAKERVSQISSKAYVSVSVRGEDDDDESVSACVCAAPAAAKCVIIGVTIFGNTAHNNSTHILFPSSSSLSCSSLISTVFQPVCYEKPESK